LGALDALATTVVLFFLLVAVALSATLRVGVPLLFVIFSKHASFRGLHVVIGVLLLRASKDNVQGFDLLVVERVGEGNLENNVQVAEFVRLLVERQTLAHNSLQVIGLDDLTGFILDSNFGSVQVRYDEVNARQRFLQGDLLLHQQVGSLALKLLMGLLLRNDNDITGLHAWELIGLAVEGVLVVVGRSLVDNCFKHLLLFDNLLAIASLALVLLVDNLTLTAALVARALGLTVHARSEHGHFHDHATSLAAIALFDSTFLATNTVASTANALSVYCNLGSLARIDLFKGQFDLVHYGLALFGACLLLSSATHAEETAEQVIHATCVGTALLEPIFSILIVEIALLLIGEALVGLLNFLKLLLVATAVGVLFQSKLSVSFFDFIECCVLFNAERLVELGVVNLFRGTTWTSHFL
jgi:hypothetical protein